MNNLEQLKPADVFRFFREIAEIPRPSGHEKAISDYLVSFAKERGLEWHQDDLNNVIIIKEASSGYEDCRPLILQGHMDMVCEKSPDCGKDMLADGLDLAVDGDWLYAEGTTLGGDDGIALAYALAFLDDDTLRHPRLEAVFTVGEEVGMDGAHGIDLSPLKGSTMLNLDMESEGQLLAGCAGGGRVNILLPAQRVANAAPKKTVFLHGLRGGHSGAEIDKGRASAVCLLTRALRECIGDIPFSLTAMAGGSKDNAITREAAAVLAVPAPLQEKLEEKITELCRTFRREYAVADPDMVLEVLDGPEQLPEEMRSLLAADLSPEDLNLYSLTGEDTRTVLLLITSLPQGVVRMSDHIPGLVETSLNLGITALESNGLHLSYSVRSSVGSAYEELAGRLGFIATQLGANVTRRAEYPAWEFNEESPLREHMAAVYEEMFGKKARIEMIHAGVECGLFSAKIPGFDAVATGPDIIDIHTPQERMSISSVERMYHYLRQVIEAWKLK